MGVMGRVLAVFKERVRGVGNDGEETTPPPQLHRARNTMTMTMTTTTSHGPTDYIPPSTTPSNKQA